MNPDANATSFDNIFISFFAVFRLLCLENWSLMSYMNQDVAGDWVLVWYLPFIFLGSLFFRNLLVAIVMARFQEACADLYRRQAQQQALGIVEFFDIQQGIQSESGLLKEYEVNGKFYGRCIQAKELITWLVEHKVVATRLEGLALGKRMLQADVVYHVLRKKKFDDNNDILRFRTDGQDDVLAPTEYKRMVHAMTEQMQNVLRRDNTLSIASQVFSR